MIAYCRDCGHHFVRDPDESWKTRCLPCWARNRGIVPGHREPDPILAEIADKMRSLLALCHPDKHNGSTLATATTQWLLDLRNRIERELV
jgi:hypothetical protein